MRIRTPVELGALIRDQRIRLGLDQKSLAEKVGVSRQWVVEVEKGKPRAEIGLILRTISALGIQLALETERQSKAKVKVRGESTVDIDSIVAAARRKRRT